MCAASCGLGGIRFGQIEWRVLIVSASLFIVDLEGAATVRTNVVEAAFGLAGVDDLSAATVWARDEVSKRGDHLWILS